MGIAAGSLNEPAGVQLFSVLTAVAETNRGMFRAVIPPNFLETIQATLPHPDAGKSPYKGLKHPVEH
ncbi:MAG: hypothetical protein QXO30_06790 [Candidatus Caldarchaeum sp.]